MSDLASSTHTSPLAPLVDVGSAQPGPVGRLRILAIHAHPDDEASKGAGTIAKLTDAGAYAVLVTCTGGEEGDILNPAMDRPEVRAELGTVRRAELSAAAGVLGYSEVVMLGYRDSGMPDTEANADPRAFANAPLAEAAGRLAEVLRVVRPHIVLTYSDDQEGYPHPDHLRVFDITAPAIELAAPDWQVQKVYFASWSRQRILAFHEKFLELGLESPYDERWFSRASQDERITTRIDVAGYYRRRKAGLIAHATQIDPDSKFWFGLPDDVAEGVYPVEDWVRVASLVASPLPEDDLGAGLAELIATETSRASAASKP
jgi:mycothiol S-conjugate amidase